ncbi:vacuolar amino acid permease [Clavulina sp. PMI_390]|nr:vacuolar amino acid permease [Clavulina sp. PMI_390]
MADVEASTRSSSTETGPPETAPLLPKPELNYVDPLSLTRAQRWPILAGVWIAQSFSALNTTLVATLMVSISSEFGSSNQASLLATAYLLAISTFTPLYGRLSNVLGRRGANQLAVFLTALGTLGSGLSKNMTSLIIWRFIAGIGGGGINTTASIIVSDMFSMRDRSLTQGIASTFLGLGQGSGGPLGGVIQEKLGWRSAFLLQLPLFALSFGLTGRFLTYSTPGKSSGVWDILKRIDYLGSLTLLVAIGSTLTFLSLYFNAEYPISDTRVISALTLAIIFSLLFVYVEIYVSQEPMLAPFLLKRRIPVLVGISWFLVSTCNFSTMYFLPMWFETVDRVSTAEAGLHLLPNAAAMSIGSLFAGWVMQKTGKYRNLSLIFGIFPALAATSISLLTPGSHPILKWGSIIPLGFGNAVVLQTSAVNPYNHIFCLASSHPATHLAIGTGFTQLFRGIGQVWGVSISSAIFQSLLDKELRRRITGPGADEARALYSTHELIISTIRHNTRSVRNFPIDVQDHARDAYAISLRAVFTFAAICTFTAFLVRLPVSKACDLH